MCIIKRLIDNVNGIRAVANVRALAKVTLRYIKVTQDDIQVEVAKSGVKWDGVSNMISSPDWRESINISSFIMLRRSSVA